MGFSIKRNLYAIQEIKKVRYYSLIGFALILLLFGMDYFDYFRSYWIMILIAGGGGIAILLTVFHSLMVLVVVFLKTLELKYGSENLFLFFVAILFMPLGWLFLQERK
jgi:hypothetical protein